MWGLVKIANEQTINFNQNYATREDRLLDELEAASDYYAELEEQRNPEVEAKARRAFLTNTWGGAGVGAGLGALISAHPRASSVGHRASAGVAGALAGGAFGLVPGMISGALRKEKIRQREEDPELLRNIDQAYRNVERAEDKIDRHHMSSAAAQKALLREEMRMRERAEVRRELRRELLGY